MPERRYVFIPVVPYEHSTPSLGLNAVHSGQLLEVYSQFQSLPELDKKALTKDWDPVAAPLRKVGLYQAGCTAASAARKLGLQRPMTAWYQFFKPQAWIEGQRLQTATLAGAVQGHSAELGLALALLMNASRTPHTYVFATGALLSEAQAHNQNAGETWRAYDVKVLPVGSLPQKLKLIIRQCRERGLPKAGRSKKVLCFTPTHYEQNGGFHEVGHLPEVLELNRLGVQVVPIGWLSEAVRLLQAHRARYLTPDRVLQGLAGSLAALGLLGLSAWGWYSWPLAMAFLPGGPTAPAAEPFVVCHTRKDQYYPLPLRQQGLVRTLPINQTLGWKVRVGNPERLPAKISAWLGYEGYYVAQIMVSQFSPAKVIIPQRRSEDQFFRIPPGGLWEWGWLLNDRAEANGLVLLARRHAPFDPDALRARLLERFPRAAGSDPTGPGLDVTAAINFLRSQAPGALSVIVQTVAAEPYCSP